MLDFTARTLHQWARLSIRFQRTGRRCMPFQPLASEPSEDSVCHRLPKSAPVVFGQAIACGRCNASGGTATVATLQREDHAGAPLARHRRRTACSRRKSLCKARRIAAIVSKPHSARKREYKRSQINWFGGDGGSPTRDLGVRSASLYASELRPHLFHPHYNGKLAAILEG